MNQLKLKLHPGIGDILLCRNHLDSIKHLYDEIYLSPSRSIVNGFREMGDGKYYDFCLSFMKSIFPDKPYKIIEDDTLPKFAPVDYAVCDLPITKDGLFKINNYSFLLCKNPSPIQCNYIVVNTKVRGTPTYSRYNSYYKNDFLKGILSLSNNYKIVVMGERTPPKSPENKMIGPERVFCIYNDLIDIIPTSKIIDITLSGDDTAVPHLDNIYRDCSIMKEAKAVITLGIGGNFILSMSVSDNSINFMEDTLYCRFYDWMINHHQRNSVIITNKWSYFMDNLQKFIEKEDI